MAAIAWLSTVTEAEWTRWSTALMLTCPYSSRPVRRGRKNAMLGGLSGASSNNAVRRGVILNKAGRLSTIVRSWQHCLCSLPPPHPSPLPPVGRGWQREENSRSDEHVISSPLMGERCSCALPARRQGQASWRLCLSSRKCCRCRQERSVGEHVLFPLP